MAELGIVYPGGPQLPTPIDIPTERGKELAAAFRSAIQKTTYYKDFFDQDEAEVPQEVILEYIRRACLCQLQADSAPDRSHVLDVFLHTPPVEDAQARRATLRMFLDIADQTKGQAIGQIPSGNSFTSVLHRTAESIILVSPLTTPIDGGASIRRAVTGSTMATRDRPRPEGVHPLRPAQAPLQGGRRPTLGAETAGRRHRRSLRDGR